MVIVPAWVGYDDAVYILLRPISSYDVFSNRLIKKNAVGIFVSSHFIFLPCYQVHHITKGSELE